MDRRIETHLEAYLQGTLDPRTRAEFEQALAGSDAETKAMVRQFEQQSRLIRSALQPAREIEPAAGFYARVMDRIEAQRGNSIWSMLLEPLFFRRLAYATAALLLLLTITFATAGTDEPTVADLLAEPAQAQSGEVVAANEPVPAPIQQTEPVVGVTSVSTGGGRDAVLHDLTVYSE
ncbi:MAG: hypothetical protein U0Q16_18455 [Bryobacteraceae bacterium]